MQEEFSESEDTKRGSLKMFSDKNKLIRVIHSYLQPILSQH